MFFPTLRAVRGNYFRERFLEKKRNFFRKKIRTQTVLSGERVKITRRRRKGFLA
ncbi:hypothetical protein LEP1GSC065_1347 [Leptospira kirschneri serovar Sokoine str. RM1]|uniref:Uncharacterized protein n=1 Tax=Leptospira kirschneri serovar Bulgarica str. Nikolaevo TaxID=1240687 RepID=M6FIZ8_9LEPT|nr:hypothetical protein LEP1GSC008_0883 [Leptospira kirschneri serovar Bulgarica str. Nikolaevo]EMN26052.1 hypothetical protein LEP1GSC065_1347 [Leptospira kirschneri serovar Sokoine str. RM1]